MRVVVFGMPCAASAPPLAALLAAGAGVEVAALVLAAGATRPSTPDGGAGDDASAPDRVAPVRPPVPDSAPDSRSRRERVTSQPTVSARGGDHAWFGAPASEPERLAAAAGVPVLPTRGVDAALVAAVRALRPDAIVVACFPRRLPPALLAVPPLGAYNVHPSLLPRNRGPEPVFWTLRRGERETGATVHLLDAGFDTGPIVAQARYPVPPGVRARDLERDLMALGGRLLVEALPALAAGRLRPCPQDDALATTAPFPTSADWLVATNLPAGWAYAFVRGVAPLAWAARIDAAQTMTGASVERQWAKAADGSPCHGNPAPGSTPRNASPATWSATDAMATAAAFQADHCPSANQAPTRRPAEANAAGRARPLAVVIGAVGRTIPVRDALDHDPTGHQDAPLIDEGNGVIRVRFRPGWVRFDAAAGPERSAGTG